MLSKDQEYQALETTETMLSVTSGTVNSEDVIHDNGAKKPTIFYCNYSDCMEMYAPSHIVAQYLDAHPEWFARCAEPMKVQPLEQNGYALVIGRFGAFNYEVEPKIGLELLPPDSEGVYRIRTIPIPDYIAPGYDVDYRASLQLVESRAEDFSRSIEMTRVEWELYLAVDIHFPKFIQRLPQSLIQTTGDRLLNQIVRQVSRRLTRKVQDDFHHSIGVSFPKKH
ncbi:hypothetical protein NIES4071_52880 [Calothrix sp. NIES-4071]|nr:hypothetical protein NIES4071_52880 [Calothrix sp. NIES-4071]BAZ59596.1 hypothetical protein NIES4105_52830 [Calothrix sp. NIES-4105]